MAYPRRCLVCRADYAVGGAAEDRHIMLRADSGGTPSPTHPEWPGRRLLLRCLRCGGEYWWDYFANAGRPLAAARDGGAPPAGRRRPSWLVGPRRG